MYITGLSDANQYDESWEINTKNVKYNEVINYISSNINVLDEICEILSKFKIWYLKISDSNLFVNNMEEKNINYYEKAENFGILYWFSKSSHLSIDSNFNDYYRILKNYIYSLRQADYKPRRRWSSSIDNKSIAKVIGFIKNQLIMHLMIQFHIMIIFALQHVLSYHLKRKNNCIKKWTGWFE